MIRKSSALDAERSALPSAIPFLDPASKKLFSSRAALFQAPVFDSPFAGSMIGFPITQMLESSVCKSAESPIALSNATNSKSPDDMKSRIFIGNLNTNLLTKRQLHTIFSAYGEIRAISMHKGFAFVQYTDQMDALNAVYAQDGRILSGQEIDVNLVTTPKSHQKSQKKVAPHDPSGDACTSSALHSSDSLMRTGSSSSSASSCSAFSSCTRTKTCSSSDPRSPDVRRERDVANSSAGSPLRHPEIELSSLLLPSSNPLAAAQQSVQANALLSRSLIFHEEESNHSIHLTSSDIADTSDLLNANGNQDIASEQNLTACQSKANMHSPVVQVTAVIGAESGESVTSEYQHLKPDESQKEEGSGETGKSLNEEMIEEVGRDGEDLREELTLSNRLLAFPLSLDCISSSMRMSEFCTQKASSSSPSAPLDPHSVACKRPRLEIPHPNRHALPCNTSVAPVVRSPPQIDDTQVPIIESSDDFMICGNCKSLFTSLPEFCKHKQRNDCRLRFVCHCRPLLTKDE